MEPLIQQIRQVLAGTFPGAEIDLEQAYPAEKVGGFVVWKGFLSSDHTERQRQIWKALRAGLSREDQLRITAIFAMTPDEMVSVREG